jgi:polar amino acid transport system substrate-binding protein
MSLPKWVAYSCSAALGLSLLVGCSSSSHDTGDKQSGLPSSLKDGLNVAMDVSYPPMEYYDNNNIVGIDPDVAKALADRLGVPVHIDNIGFDSLISSLQANRADVLLSGMKDTPDRRERLNMIDYFKTNLALLVAENNPKNITDLASLCGKTAGQVTGTATLDQVTDASKKCPAGQTINVLGFGSNADVNAAIRAGRVDANLEDAVSLDFVVASGGFSDIPQPQLGTEYFGMATLKSDNDTTNAIRNAYKSLLADGTIKSIYDKHHVTNAVPDSFMENQGQ